MEDNLFIISGYAIEKRHEKPANIQEFLSESLKELWIPLCVITNLDSDYGESFLNSIPDSMEAKALIVSVKYTKTFLS